MPQDATAVGSFCHSCCRKPSATLHALRARPPRERLLRSDLCWSVPPSTRMGDPQHLIRAPRVDARGCYTLPTHIHMRFPRDRDENFLVARRRQFPISFLGAASPMRAAILDLSRRHAWVGATQLIRATQ